MFPSWDSKYTTNINMEMNYLAIRDDQSPNFNEPLFRLICEVSETGKGICSDHVMARTDGSCITNTDIWRVNWWYWRQHQVCGMTGGAWVSSHLWQHYLIVATRNFYAKLIRLWKGAATFLDEMLIPELSMDGS